MPHDRFQRLVQQTVEIDVAATWAEFATTTENADPDAFLSFLRARDLIDANAFVELHANDAIALEAPDEAPEGARYDLLGQVGQGAMGTVHVARDVDLRRKVAFKTMLRSDPLLRRRFLDEVRITAQLDHPNIVPVYSLSRDAHGRPAYAMKLVRGRTLGSLLAAARTDEAADELGLPARLELFIKVCDAVAYAHDKGILHRDLKPENVMVGRFGEVYVMDWGIAKQLGQPDPPPAAPAEPSDGPADRTRAGALVGTPAYMSPEQANGEGELLGAASDQFALGLLLYEVVHLQLARRSDDVVGLLLAASTGKVDPPDRPAHPELEAIIHRATRPDPTLRYPSVQALEADVRRHLRGEELAALPDSLLGKLRRWTVRNQRSTGFIVAAALLASFAAVGWSGYRREADLATQRLESQVRERQVAERLGQVSGRAQRIDNDLLWYEGMLQAIGESTLYALSRGTPTDGPWYHTADYRDVATSPPGMSESTAYGKPVHTDYPVYTVAPGVPESLWRRDLGLVDGVRDTIRKVFLVDPYQPTPDGDREVRRRRIADGSRSLRWAYVALEQSGLMYMFPGAKGWDDKYDPRTRPWYREGVGRHGHVWSAPYVDLMGQGRLISCILPLYGPDEAFLGVAGLDLQFNKLLDELLALPALEGYKAAYLLTGEGRVMLKTTAEDDPVVIPPTEAIDPGIDFGMFAHRPVVEGARAHRPGHHWVGDELLVWAPLQHLGWTYVVAAETTPGR